ncbi:MAG: hypothetical protein ABDH37_01135 [Candidatus Hydrothermales bacterium]
MIRIKIAHRKGFMPPVVYKTPKEMQKRLKKYSEKVKELLEKNNIPLEEIIKWKADSVSPKYEIPLKGAISSIELGIRSEERSFFYFSIGEWVEIELLISFFNRKDTLASFSKDGGIDLKLPQYLNFVLLEPKMQELFFQFVEYFRNVHKNNVVELIDLIVSVTPKIYQIEKRVIETFDKVKNFIKENKKLKEYSFIKYFLSTKGEVDFSKWCFCEDGWIVLKNKTLNFISTEKLKFYKGKIKEEKIPWFEYYKNKVFEKRIYIYEEIKEFLKHLKNK